MKKILNLFISMIFLVSSTASASFEENARRYLSGQEILWSLSVYFDFTKNVDSSDLCSHIRQQNSSYAGSNSPATGEPISPAPSQSTVLWITGCIEDYLADSNFIAADSVRLQNLVGPESLLLLGAQPATALKQPWATWTLDQKKDLIIYMVQAFLGPDDVIEDFGFIQNPDDFRTQILAAADAKPQANILQIVTLLAVNLSVRDEFLSY